MKLRKRKDYLERKRKKEQISQELLYNNPHVQDLAVDVEDPLDIQDEIKEKYDNDFEDDLNFNDNDFELNDNLMGETALSPMEKHADLLKGLTNFNPYIKGLLMGWMGLVWNEEKKQYVKDLHSPPIMNARGARWCSDLLKTYIRNNNIITYLDEDTYNNIMEDHIQNVLLNLGTRIEDFEIYEVGDLIRVINEMEHAVNLMLSGTGGGKYSEFLRTTVQRNENITNGDQFQQGFDYRRDTRNKSGFMDKVRNALRL